MRMRTKVWLIIAASLVLLGCILFAGVMTTLKWDFMELATVKYETNTYEITEAFDGISMNTDTADIAFVLSDDGNCSVECHEEANAKHSVTVEDGTLTVELIDERSVYDFIEYIGLNFGSPKITVYLPQNEFNSLLMKTDTGDIDIPENFYFENVNIESDTADIDFLGDASMDVKLSTDTGDINVNSAFSNGDIYVETDTGDITLTDIKCDKLTAESDTGKISLSRTVAKDSFSIENGTGDVVFEKSDAQKIFVETDTGDVTGSLLTDKVFVTETSTGDVNVPKTASGGRCEITTSTGNVKIEIE